MRAFALALALLLGCSADADAEPAPRQVSGCTEAPAADCGGLVRNSAPWSCPRGTDFTPWITAKDAGGYACVRPPGSSGFPAIMCCEPGSP